MDTTHAMQILQDLGYEVSFRSDAWIDCLATGHHEAWVGSGRDEHAATADLLRKMFPSRAATTLLEGLVQHFEQPKMPIEYLDEMVRGLELLNAPKPAASLLEEMTQGPEEAPLAEVVAVQTAEAASEVQAEEATIDVVSVSSPESEARPQTFVSVEDVVNEISVEAISKIDVGAPLEPLMSVEDALEILDSLADEIDAEMDTTGRMAPSHMRLHVASWIFQARAVQEHFRRDGSGNRAVEDSVHRIALQLTRLCKIFWPGNVMALNLHCTPGSALQGFFRPAREPTTWAEATSVLSTHMEEIERASPDDAGWRDRGALRPEAPKPAAVLEEAVSLVERAAGPLDMLPNERKERVTVSGILEHLEGLVLAAHLLRWTRHACPDGVRWGRAMGVLRWCARECRGQARTLDEVLSEGYVPTRGWAEMLGRDPEVNRRKRLQREVLEDLPTPEGLEENLLGWLRKAFMVFNNPQIAKMASAVRGEILALSKADFADADRSTRSRLHRLQGILRSEQPIKVDLPALDELKGDEDDEAEEAGGVDPAEELLSRVRELTQGKRILFVTNRDDTRLRDELARDLECEVMLKNGGTPRMIKSIVDSVTSTRYDIVCMATGFNNHSSDALLCRKAKVEGVPYVRVQKGRRLQTIRALGRAFNLFGEGKLRDAQTSLRAG